MRPDIVPSAVVPALKLADAAVELQLAAREAERQLLALELQPMAANLAVLRVQIIAFNLRQLAALRLASEVMKDLSVLPPAILLSLGIHPDSGGAGQ